MTVQEVLNIYLAEDNYVDGSMINKSFDDEGCVYKWLSSNNANSVSILNTSLNIAVCNGVSS